MPPVHMHNFESISAAEKDTHKTCLHIQREIHFLSMSLTHITCMNINEAHTHLVALKNCPVVVHMIKLNSLL